MSRLHVDVWSDIACPWCYVGKRRLERALEKFSQRALVDVHWHSFELDPSAPPEVHSTLTHAEWLARKYRTSVPTAAQRIAQLTALARADGIDLQLDRLRQGNSFDAHRLLHLAREKGLQSALKERFLRAYFSEGEAIGRRDTLQRLAVEIGLAGDEVGSVLESGLYADEVRADERQASELGIRGVPFFVIGERYGISGAQPAELLLAALEKAWSEAELDPGSFVEGAVCEPESC